jgi:hypothetical protein
LGVPRTLDELAERRSPPLREWFVSTEAYLYGFYLWRALSRDRRLTRAEAAAAFEVTATVLGERTGLSSERVAGWVDEFRRGP